MVPTVALPPIVPPANQITVGLIILSPEMVAVNCSVSPGPAVMYPVGATVIVCAYTAAQQTNGARCLPILNIRKILRLDSQAAWDALSLEYARKKKEIGKIN
jgi:hypothetical protein